MQVKPMLTVFGHIHEGNGQQSNVAGGIVANVSISPEEGDAPHKPTFFFLTFPEASL